MRLVRVAVPVPSLEALTYCVPEDFADPIVGARVLVPLGNRTVTGIVVESLSAPRSPLSGEDTGNELPIDTGSTKPLIDILDDEAFLPPDVVRLALWVAEYYASGAGEAMATAMPPRAWIESERYAQMTDLGVTRLLTERGLRRTILDALDTGKPVRTETVLAQAPNAHATLLGLERDGLIEITRPLKGVADAHRTVRVAVLTAQGHDIAGDGACLADAAPQRRRGKRQEEALSLLLGSPEGIDTSELDARGISAATLKRLAGMGLVSFARRRVERDPFEQAAALDPEARTRHTLTDEQAAACEKLRELAATSAFQTVLLHGVTGSGKTELYLRLAEDVTNSGRGVLLLVPEIALTPAVAALFRATFGDRVAIQHSALSDGERHDQWQRIRRGEVDVVVGTRSAVFAPVRNLGLLIVDEEHDGSYKQEGVPRYHGRDVAVVRASHAGALAILGSATPSMESYQNAQSGRYTLIALERRVLDRPMASVSIVDMREEFATEGPDVILSRQLTDGLAARLERKEQAIVLLNRRGFATAVFCRQCGSTFECPNCSVCLTVHKRINRARCHYCNYSMAVPKTCATCAGPYLEQVGFGTERVEAEIVAQFPGARVARVDRDTVRRRGAIVGLLSRFAAGEIDILVGTQMIAKGHDFPRVTLVGVISADVGLGLADFRAAERTFQLLTQVAGRAGRGEILGEAVVQTIYPRHYSIRHACRQDYGAFFAEELNYRKAMRYPPSVALINVIVKARTQAGAMDDAGDLVNALRFGSETYRVLGPAPAPLSRLKGEHRAQLFIKGTHRAAMRTALLTALSSKPELRRRVVIDVDPMTVL